MYYAKGIQVIGKIYYATSIKQTKALRVDLVPGATSEKLRYVGLPILHRELRYSWQAWCAVGEGKGAAW